MKEKIRMLLEANGRKLEEETVMFEATPQTPPSKPHEPPRPHEPGKHEPEKEPKPDPSKEEPEHEGVAPPPPAHSFTTAQLQALVTALRQPQIDPIKEERKKRMREHNRRLRKDQHNMLITRFYSCNHMQLPGSVLSGCSVVAWATQSDNVKRGQCMHCGTVFSPRREECASREIWEAYAMLVRIPTHPGGNYNAIFQSA